MFYPFYLRLDNTFFVPVNTADIFFQKDFISFPKFLGRFILLGTLWIGIFIFGIFPNSFLFFLKTRIQPTATLCYLPVDKPCEAHTDRSPTVCLLTLFWDTCLRSNLRHGFLLSWRKPLAKLTPKFQYFHLCLCIKNTFVVGSNFIIIICIVIGQCSSTP